jgi:uroporphyrinogen decarboxylase
LEDIADCGYAAFSLDNVVDLAVAKERIGSRIHLIGNVDPSNVLYLGTPEIVRTAVRECFRKAGDSPGGYTIATGCDTVYGTPLENSFAFMAEAREQARIQPRPKKFQEFKA